MGAFDKKTKRNIGLGSLIIGAIAILANISQIIDAWDKLFDKDTKTNTQTTIVAESPNNSNQEKNEPPQTEKVTQPPTETPTEPQPTEPPVDYLNNLTLSDSKCFHNDEDIAEDTVGNTYTSRFLVIGESNDWFESKPYGMYYLGGKYKTLSGTIAVGKNSKNGYIGDLTILCDDNSIYDTGQVGKAFAPTEISLNVEGCQWLKFSLFTWSSDGIACDGMQFILSDFKLE